MATAKAAADQHGGDLCLGRRRAGANAQDPLKNYCNNESTVSYNMLTVLLVCRFNGGWGLGSVPVVLFLVDCLPEVLLL